MQQTLQRHESVAGRGFNTIPKRIISMQITEVYQLPKMLTDIQIDELLRLRELKCHHDDGSHGHDDVGHGGGSTEEPDEKKPKKGKPKKKKEKDSLGGNKDDKVNLHHFRADKPHKLPWVASLIWQNIPDIRIGNLRPYDVDENMQLYRLQEGAGIVPQHVDEDFYGPNQSIALCSILIYLNNGYSGGETVFNRMTTAPHTAVGGGLLFRHDILHEGLPVLSGEKYVLKTDLFFRRK